jgi:hypothetical protein
MRSALESLDDNDITVNFLRHSLIVIHGFLRDAGVYDAVQEIVKAEQSAVTFTSTLEVFANFYVATFNPESEKWNGFPDSVRRSIEVLNLINIKPMRALLLAIAAKFDKNEVANAFQYIVALEVRLVVASGSHGGNVDTGIANAAHAVYLGKITTCADLKKSLLDITPSNGQFQSAFETAKVSSAKFARYYLRSLEMAAKGESEPWFMPTDDRSIINLEHILPKKSQDNWPEFSADEADLVVNRLGNQALLRASENCDLRSSNFESKRSVYQNSPYLLTSQIAQFTAWTSESIDRRQKALAELALTTWPV